MPLDFDENIFATEDVDKKLRAIGGTPGSARALACRIRRLAECTTNVEEILQAQRFSGGGAGNSTRGACAPQQYNKPFRKFRQLVPLNGALSLLTAEMRLRQQLAQICVTRAILHQHGQNRPILHAQFAADNGPDILLPSGDRKSLRPINPVAIEQRHRRHLELGRGFS